jgi:hypothetical protein
MRRYTVASVLTAAVVVVATTMGGSRAAAQSAETFVATASAKTAAGATITAPLEISITRWTSDADREKAVAALKSGGLAALKTALEKAPQTGTIRIGERQTPLHFARALDTGAGKVITVIAPQPLLHLGAGMPEAKPREGYDFAVALFEVNAAGQGNAGELAPAAKLAVKADGSFTIDDYGAEAVRFAGITKK